VKQTAGLSKWRKKQEAVKTGHSSDAGASPSVVKSDKPDRNGPLKTLGRLAEVVNRASSSVSKQGEAIRTILGHIAVIAFIGPSGTGKSTHAIRIAGTYHIDYIMDDGLLIHGSRIIAGTSAKKAPSRLESVRQALFADETRAAVMRRALAAHRPSTLMVLGTSDAMLEKICQNLWLNQPAILIRIEDVITEEEMRLAREVRLSQGKHTIPVPSMEVKHEFSGTLADSFARLRRRRDKHSSAQEIDRTVVRPTFSGLGSYSMSDEAMRMMIEIVLSQTPGVAGLTQFNVRNEVYGVVLDIDLSLFYGFNAPEVLQTVQERVSQQIENDTAITVMAVNVRARRVVHQTNREPDRQKRKQA
jgi:uncharacterized alkaline shock family protein YloU